MSSRSKIPALRRLRLTRILLQGFSEEVSYADLERDMKLRGDCTPRELKTILGFALENCWLEESDGRYSITERGERLLEALKGDVGPFIE